MNVKNFCDKKVKVKYIVNDEREEFYWLGKIQDERLTWRIFKVKSRMNDESLLCNNKNKDQDHKNLQIIELYSTGILYWMSSTASSLSSWTLSLSSTG